eukprot:3134550-Amphidinium_carterae.1
MENYLETVKKKRTKDTENEGDKTWLQKLLSISSHHTPTFLRTSSSRTSTHYERQDLTKLKYNYIEKRYRV